MKVFTGLGLILNLCLLQSLAHADGPTPLPTPVDLILQTRTDAKTTTWIIEKTRVLMANVPMDDHLAATVEVGEIPLITLEDVTSASYVKIRNMMASIFKVDLVNAAIRIRIPKVKYRVDRITAHPIEMHTQDPVLRIHTEGGVQGLYAELTDGLMIDFMIPNPKTKKYDSYLTANIDQVSVLIPQSLPPLPLDVTLEATRDKEFTYKLISHNLSLIPNYVRDHQKSFILLSGEKPISADTIHVNPVIIRLNDLHRSVKFEEFRPVVQSALPDILKFVLNQVGMSLKNKIGPSILKTAFSSSTRSDLISTTPSIYTRFATTQFNQPASDQLLLRLAGELCTAKNYAKHKELCILDEEKVAPVRHISEAEQKVALDEITRSIAQGMSDTVLSVSEEYINRLLRTTINAELWNERLQKQNLRIGPKGIFMVFNEKTKTPQLLMDCLYTGDGKGIKGGVVKALHIRFPLRISTSFKFENRNGIPFMVIRTEKLLSDEDEIVNGIDEYDMDSKLVIGFRHKISRMVIAMAKEVENQTAIEMDLPMFKNVGLEDTHYEVSKHGRLNLFFKL